MQEETTGGGQTTINQYPNNNGGWGGPGGWGGWGYPVPAYPAYGYGNGGFGGLEGLMRGFGGNINIGRGGGMTGTALGLAIAALGLPVVGALAGRGFGFGGPGGPGCDNLVTKDYLGLVKENAALNSVIAQKDSKIYTDEKVSDVMKFLIEWRQRQEIVDNTAAAEVATLKAKNANLEATLNNMLGTYIAPQAFGPSQAVFSQIQAAASSKGASPSGTGS